MKGRFLIIIICLLTLCGCSDYAESNSQYMVSAIGFDSDGENIIASTQTVIIESNGEEKQETKVFTAKGKTPAQALFNISGYLSKSLLFDHCGVVAIGKGISKETLGKIFDYSNDEKNLNLGVYFVCTDSAEELLNADPVSFVASGYDIMGIIEKASDETGILYQNRFYEIKALEAKKGKVFSLPFFECKEDGIKMNGRNIYRDREFVTSIDENESYIYSVICNSNKGGKIILDGQKAKINKMHTSFKYNYENETVNINLKTVFSFEYKSKNFKKTLQKDANDFIRKMSVLSNKDVFGFDDRIYIRNSSLYESIKDGYSVKTEYTAK